MKRKGFFSCQTIPLCLPIHLLLQCRFLLHFENPDIVVVLVRTVGLWGSIFSRALTQGRAPDMIKGLKKSLWIILKNAIFFTPRRRVDVEFELVGQDFPRTKSKNELNRY